MAMCVKSLLVVLAPYMEKGCKFGLHVLDKVVARGLRKQRKVAEVFGHQSSK